MKQSSLLQFEKGPHENHQSPCGSKRARRLLEESVFEAETAELFRALFKSSRGRYPNAADWNRYFGLHPDQFARITGRNWEQVRREVRKMVERADAALKKAYAMKSRAEEVD